MASNRNIPLDIKVDITDENQLRLIILTKKIGLKYAKKIFLKHFPKDPLQLYIALLPYEKKLKLFPDQWQILYGTPAQGSNIDDYDLSLMLKIVKLKKDPNDKTLKALQEFRNFLAHYPSKPLPNIMYLQKYQDIKQILMALGASSAEIDYFLGCQINITHDEKQKIIEELLRDIRRGTTEPITDLVLDEVLVIVSKHIGILWKKLAVSLQIPIDTVNDIVVHPVTDELKMNECFEQMSNNVSWRDLQQQLKKLNRDDIVDNIQQNSCVTVAVKEASDNLKRHYRNILNKVEQRDSLVDPSKSQYKSVSRQEAYVNLTLSGATDFDDAIVNSDHMFNLHNQFTKCKPVDIADVIKFDDSVVAIRGIGGIGKSTFTDNYVLEWTGTKVLPEVNLLFYLKCREIGTVKAQTIEGFLLQYFPTTLNKIPVDVLREIGKNIVIILDGLDELGAQNQSKIQEIIKQNVSSGANFRICITGRPNSIQQCLMKVKRTIVPKLIDVMGFTMESIELYISRHYENDRDKELKIAKMKHILTENLEMKCMASIPAYLMIICYINDDTNGVKSANTNTNLCLLASLVIIREHHKNLQLFDESLSSVSENNDVLRIILKLAEISFRSLREGKIVLSESDLGESKNDLEECGFLSRYVSSTEGQAYQFRHLIFSEFLCGLHLFLMGDDGFQLLFESETSSLLWNALPTLLSFRSKQTDCFLSNFLSKITTLYRRNNDMSVALDQMTFKRFPGTIDLLKKLFDASIKIENRTVHIDESWVMFLTSMHECQDYPPKFLIDLIASAKQIQIDIKYHHQLRCIVYLFQYIPIAKTIDGIDIRLNDSILTEEELENMKNILVRCKKINIECKFNTQLFTDITMKTNTEFHSLQRLSLVSIIPDDINQLFQFVPFLELFQLDCTDLPVESASILSGTVIKSKNGNNLLLDCLLIHFCSNEEMLLKVTPCIPYLRTFQIYDSNVSINSIKQLSQVIKQAAITFTIHEEFLLLLQSCHLTNNHIAELSSSLPYLYALVLYNNPDISDNAYTIIVDMILQQVELNGLSKLKKLCLSHVYDDHINILLPIMPYLDRLFIDKSNNLTIESIIAIRKSITNRSSKIRLYLDEDIPIDKDLIKDIFADVQQYVTIKYGKLSW